jgi:hypothetical protein
METLFINPKVKVMVTSGLSEETISKIEPEMIYLGTFIENETKFVNLKNSKNEYIGIFPERIKFIKS